MWKRIHYNHYEINKKGVVRRVKPERGTWPGRELTPYSLWGGEMEVALCRNGIRTQITISKLLKRAFG
jgi:hypothetical protein